MLCLLKSNVMFIKLFFNGGVEFGSNYIPLTSTKLVPYDMMKSAIENG